VRNAVGIFGSLAGAIVVALVARYGFATSDTRLDGAIAAFFFAVIAIGGIGGPAVAVHLFRSAQGWGRAWGVIAGVIAAVALLANLSNSLGAIAGRADRTLAERSSAKDARKDAREALISATKTRDALPAFTPATADDVAAARDAVTAAEKASKAECGDGDPKQRRLRCLAREGDERTKRDALATVLANKALSDRAAKLDADAAAAHRKLETAPPVANVNPMAETLARIFHVQADDAATWQQVATVIVVELLIAFALIAFELLASERKGAPKAVPAPVAPAVEAYQSLPPIHEAPPVELRASESVTPITLEPLHPRRPRKPAVALIETGRAPGDVAKFAVACLRPAAGGSIAIPALYQPYSRWCEAHGFRAVSITKFEELFAQLCDLSGFTRSVVAGEARCLNLEIAA
jgi:hypothetical protein